MISPAALMQGRSIADRAVVEKCLGRILVVDDNPVSARILQANLAKAGHEVVGARDGATALEALAQSPVDAMIADLAAGGGMGMQIVAEVRDRAEWRGLPILVTSDTADSSVVREAGARGVQRFLLKPLDIPALLSEIHRVLEQAPQLQLLPPEVALKTLSLEASQYSELLGDLSQLIDEATAGLDQLDPGDGEIDLERLSGVMEAMRKLGAVVSSVSTGSFLELPDAVDGSADRPSMDDWLRVAARDLKTLQAQVRSVLEADQAPVPDAPPEADSSEPEPSAG